MRHQLALDIPLVTNARILRINDFSLYTSALPVECPRLEITVPGFTRPAVIEVSHGFNLNINSCQLGLQTHGCADETFVLPDGIYQVRYSVAPPDKVSVAYHHLRMTAAWNGYYGRLGTLGLGACGPEEDQARLLRSFQVVRAFMEAAKAKVEYCHEPEKGMELFLYAQRMLNRLTGCAPCMNHLNR